VPREFSRTLRLNAQLQRELTGLIRTDLTDPRVAGVTVTAVKVSPDARSARILVSLLGDETQLAAAVEALNGAAGRLRHSLGKQLSLRYVPAMYFVADTALREGDRINALIRQVRAKEDEAAGRAAAEPDEG
jgi:ribosome-binding factor A